MVQYTTQQERPTTVFHTANLTFKQGCWHRVTLAVQPSEYDLPLNKSLPLLPQAQLGNYSPA